MYHPSRGGVRGGQDQFDWEDVKADKYRENYLGESRSSVFQFPHNRIWAFILLHEKFLQFDWLRAVVFQLNFKYLHVKITNPLQVVV